MKRQSESLLQRWLSRKGEAWKDGVIEASQLLLSEYLDDWGAMIPVELHRLASLHKAKIVPLKNLEGEALLMPTRAGFRILVKANNPVGRYRTSVAHELAHTLFFTNPREGTPQRLIPHSKREEHFCFDVARHLLAPKIHLETIGVYDERDPGVVLKKLTESLLLSRPLAARLMLADYKLANGIAGRWVHTENGWKHEFWSSAATPSLSRQDRSELRAVAKRYLADSQSPLLNFRVNAVPEESGNAVFLLVTSRGEK